MKFVKTKILACIILLSIPAAASAEGPPTVGDLSKAGYAYNVCMYATVEKHYKTDTQDINDAIEIAFKACAREEQGIAAVLQATKGAAEDVSAFLANLKSEYKNAIREKYSIEKPT